MNGDLVTVLGGLLGGVGLFLLGMWLMTDGLKLTAGPAPPARQESSPWSACCARMLRAFDVETGARDTATSGDADAPDESSHDAPPTSDPGQCEADAPNSASPVL